MRNKEKEPFLPFVTVDDILKFEPAKAETYTESRFVNAVLRAIDRVGAADTKRIASFLALDEHTLNYGVRIACGTSLTGLRRIVTITTTARMYAENPKVTLDEVACFLGYANRSSVWAILNDKKYAEITNRLCPGLLQQKQRRNTTETETSFEL